MRCRHAMIDPDFQCGGAGPGEPGPVQPDSPTCCQINHCLCLGWREWGAEKPNQRGSPKTLWEGRAVGIVSPSAEAPPAPPHPWPTGLSLSHSHPGLWHSRWPFKSLPGYRLLWEAFPASRLVLWSGPSLFLHTPLGFPWLVPCSSHLFYFFFHSLFQFMFSCCVLCIHTKPPPVPSGRRWDGVGCCCPLTTRLRMRRLEPCPRTDGRSITEFEDMLIVIKRQKARKKKTEPQWPMKQ